MKLLFALMLVVTCSGLARADAGLPMIALMYPMFIAALIPVIAIEMLVVAHRLNVSKRSVLKSVSVANTVSTLLGYPLAWVLSLGGWLIFTGIAWGFDKFSRVDLWRWIAESSWRDVILMPFQFAWLPPLNDKDGWWIIPMAALIGLIPAFFISVYTEAYILKKMLKLDRSSAKEISFRAQVASYTLLVFLILGFALYCAIGQSKHR